MAFDHLSRPERRAMMRVARTEAAKRPSRLTQMPRETWPEYPGEHEPLAVWHSRRYLVQLFEENPFQGITTLRMTVCRTTLASDGHWEDGLTWDELHAIKSEIGFADWYGIEIYPRACDVVNVASMRHVWLLKVPLAIGW